MGTVVVGVVVGLITGAVSSFAVWWSLTHAVSSKLAWADKIACTSSGDYRIKLANLGTRDALDVTYTLRLRIPNLTPGSKASTLVLRTGHIPVVSPRSEANDRWFAIRPENMPRDQLEMYRRRLPQELVAAIETYEPSAHLGRFFDLRADGEVELELAAFSTDKFSRTRAVATGRLTSLDVANGGYDFKAFTVSNALDDADGEVD